MVPIKCCLGRDIKMKPLALSCPGKDIESTMIGYILYKIYI